MTKPSRRYPQRKGDLSLRTIVTERGERLIMTEAEFARFNAKHRVDPETGCWRWTAARTSTGYACFAIEQRNQLGHRLSYMHHVGPVPKGFTVEHSCKNKRCVNPRHLEVVTRGENAARGGDVDDRHPMFSDDPEISSRRWMYIHNFRAFSEISSSRHGDRDIILVKYANSEGKWVTGKGFFSETTKEILVDKDCYHLDFGIATTWFAEVDELYDPWPAHGAELGEE